MEGIPPMADWAGLFVFVLGPALVAWQLSRGEDRWLRIVKVVGCMLLSWYGVLVIALGNLLEDWIAGGSEGEQVREPAGEGSPGAG